MEKQEKIKVLGNIISIIGSILIIVALFLSWVKQGDNFFTISISGWKFVPNCRYLIALGIIAGICSLISNKIMPFIVLLCGLTSGIFLIFLYSSMNTSLSGHGIIWSLQWGFWLSVVSSLLIIIGSSLSLTPQGIKNTEFDVSSQSQSNDNIDIKQEVDLISLHNRENDIKNQLKVIRSKFSILENAYVASNISTGPKEMAEIEKVLSDILSEGDIGLSFLLERIMVGVTLSGNNISLHNWGEDTFNELIKKQIIIKAIGAAKVKGAIPKLEILSKAKCDYGQWRECITGPLNRAITAINS